MSSSFLWADSGIVFNNCALALNGTVSKLKSKAWFWFIIFQLSLQSCLCSGLFEPKTQLRFVVLILITQNKKHSNNCYCVFYGRIVGFEPTYIGTTIRGLNHLTISAIRKSIISKQLFSASYISFSILSFDKFRLLLLLNFFALHIHTYTKI